MNKNTHLLQYPRLLCFVLSCMLAYVLFWQGAFFSFIDAMNGYGYVSFFIGGILFSFGFTSPFGVAMLIEAASHANPFLAAPVAGVGALLSDLSIFGLARLSFTEELHQLGSMPLLRRLHSLLHHERVSENVRRYLLWSIAGFIIASPLPDEFGVTLLSGVNNVKGRWFSILCFTLNTIGIFLIIVGAKAVG